VKRTMLFAVALTAACRSSTAPTSGTIQFVNHSSVTQLPYIYDSTRHTTTFGNSISDTIGAPNTACAAVTLGDQLIVAMSARSRVVGPAGLVTVSAGSPHWTFTMPDSLSYTFVAGASCSP